MLKKLEKCYAEVAYLKAKRSQNEADKARNWLYFIQLSIKMPLIE